MMRRPVVFLFLFFAFGIAFEFYFMLKPAFLTVSIVFMLLLYSFARIRKWYQQQTALACLFLLVVLLGSLFFYLAENNTDPLEKIEGQRCTIQGRVITVQINDENSYRMLVTAQNAGRRLVQVKGSIEDPAEYVGKWAVVNGTVSLPSERRNPGLFDYRLYLKTKGVRVILQTDSNHIKLDRSRSAIIPSLIARLKYDFLKNLGKTMSPEAFGMVVGMLFGDCSFISEEIYEAFQKNGIAHILSVSGIHVGIVYLYINKLLGNRKTYTFYLITMAMLIFYAALSEFSTSVVRAVVMIFIHMFSKISYHRYDFTCCTAASAIAMLI
ncbi:MAG: ComEC/Rec2 family competence protein, partial [Bacillota bacterium]